MNAHLERAVYAIVLLGVLTPLADAKPIAFAHGTTVMAEYGAGTMIEAQVFYAPSFRHLRRPRVGRAHPTVQRNAWLEAGATREGKLQAMLMFNFWGAHP